MLNVNKNNEHDDFFFTFQIKTLFTRKGIQQHIRNKRFVDIIVNFAYKGTINVYYLTVEKD